MTRPGMCLQSSRHLGDLGCQGKSVPLGTAALPTLMELSYNSVITFVSSPRFQGCDSKKPQGSGAPGFSPLGTLAKLKYLAEGLKKKKKKDSPRDVYPLFLTDTCQPVALTNALKQLCVFS